MCKIVLIIIIFAGFVFSQTKANEKSGDDFQNPPFPIVYGNANDGYPQKIKVSGVIVGASSAPAACGVFATAGTLKINLTKKVEGYNSDYLYAFVPCFMDDEKKLLNKNIEVDAVKLDEQFFARFDLLSNDFDSKNVPFYKLAGINGGIGVLKSLKAINKNKKQ